MDKDAFLSFRSVEVKLNLHKTTKPLSLYNRNHRRLHDCKATKRISLLYKVYKGETTKTDIFKLKFGKETRLKSENNKRTIKTVSLNRRKLEVLIMQPKFDDEMTLMEKERFGMFYDNNFEVSQTPKSTLRSSHGILSNGNKLDQTPKLRSIEDARMSSTSTP